MKDVLLNSTLHDPRGVFLDTLQNAGKVVLDNYKGWVINVTTTTDQRIKDTLRSLAPQGIFMTETDPNNSIVPDKVENDHLYLLSKTVEIAKELGARKIQYTDGDRIVTAATHYPHDLQLVSTRVSEALEDNKSYLNLRRSPEDYFFHHPPLVQTEFEFNRLYSKVFGMPIDIGSTAHGMSLDVVEEILHRSPQMESVSFPHPKWLIIAKEMGIPIKSEETKNMLTFETPDQFRKEVEARTGETSFPHHKLQQDYMATLGLDSTLSPKEWDLRFNTQMQYVTLLKNHLGIFGFNEDKKNTLLNEIDHSLTSIDGRHNAIAEALKKPPEEIHKMIQERAEHALHQKPFNPESK